MKKVFITGINGQDGSYLSEFLLNKNYEVHGLVRRASTDNTLCNIAHIMGDIKIHYGDMIDTVNLCNLIGGIKPDEVYNLAAQSQVGVSFVSPSYTENVNALGPLRMLEAIKLFCPECRFYQASTSELFGHCEDGLLDEKSKFHPVSPYAISKLNAFWYVKYFREAYDIFAVNGILFNHESPRRSGDFVTKKIVKQACEIKYNKRKTILLGNLESLRDWGFAGDYVRAMWKMLQRDTPDDYVIATGEAYSVQDFCDLVFSSLGINLSWEGEGKNKKAIDSSNDNVVIEVSEDFYRPLDVARLRGNSEKARKILGWNPEVSFTKLVKIMIEDELKNNYKKEEI